MAVVISDRDYSELENTVRSYRLDVAKQVSLVADAASKLHRLQLDTAAQKLQNISKQFLREASIALKEQEQKVPVVGEGPE